MRRLPGIRSRRADWAVGAGALAWAIWFAILAVNRHETYRSHRFDLGNMVQAVWSTAHGRPLELTLADGRQLSRLGVHVDPILALFAPLWWVVPSPALLLVVQPFALASGVFPVLWLARRHLASERLALALAAAYLLYPWVAWGALNDFHPVTLAVPLLLYAFWFLDGGRLGWFALFAVLACATGELVGLEIGALGVWYAVAQRRRLAGGAIAVAGFAWTFLALKVVVPAVSGGSSPFYGRYDSVGGSPGGLLTTLVTDPAAIVDALTTRADAHYVVWLLAPLLGLPVLGPGLALVAAPQFVLNALADWGSATLTKYQYSSAVLPFLVAAIVTGLRRVPARRREALVGALLVSTAVWFAVAGPRPGSPSSLYGAPADTRHRNAIADALALVPAAAPVSSTNEIGAHLSERRRVESFPERREAEWLVLDTGDTWLAAAGEQDDPQLLARSLRAVAADRSWERVLARDGILVYRRAGAG
jgi:uncharacterized membrane protein